MGRQCAITGKKVVTGNNVSHAHNKTRRTFVPNIQATSVYSEILERSFKIRVTAAGLRTLERKGGVDAYVRGTAISKLSPDFQKIKKLVEKADAKAA